MCGNCRDEIQQLRQDRDRREERGGQQERDRGAGGAAVVAGGIAGGAGGAAREEVGEGRLLLSKNSLFLLRTLCTLPGLSRRLGCVLVSSPPAQGSLWPCPRTPFPWVI